jgi:hypothetical protein
LTSEYDQSSRGCGGEQSVSFNAPAQRTLFVIPGTNAPPTEIKPSSLKATPGPAAATTTAAGGQLRAAKSTQAAQFNGTSSYV